MQLPLVRCCGREFKLVFRLLKVAYPQKVRQRITHLYSYIASLQQVSNILPGGTLKEVLRLRWSRTSMLHLANTNRDLVRADVSGIPGLGFPHLLGRLSAKSPT